MVQCLCGPASVNAQLDCTAAGRGKPIMASQQAAALAEADMRHAGSNVKRKKRRRCPLLLAIRWEPTNSFS